MKFILNFFSLLEINRNGFNLKKNTFKYYRKMFCLIKLCLMELLQPVELDLLVQASLTFDIIWF